MVGVGVYLLSNLLRHVVDERGEEVLEGQQDVLQGQAEEEAAVGGVDEVVHGGGGQVL